MKKIKPIKTAWMCIAPIRKIYYPNYNSIAYTRKEAINKFTNNVFSEWADWKKQGWQCVKVSIEFTLINPQP